MVFFNLKLVFVSLSFSLSQSMIPSVSWKVGNKAAEKFNLCFLIHTYVPCFQIPSYFTVKGRMCCASKTV